MSIVKCCSPADTVDELGESLAVLAGNTLDVSLEDKEVLRLDQHIEFLQLGIVGCPSDRLGIQSVRRLSGRRDTGLVSPRQIGSAGAFD